MSLSFGTDGVRGVANVELTPEYALALGRAAARVLTDGGGAFLTGRDTRISGPLLQSAFSAGVASEGVDVYDLGILPTPGVAAVSAVYGVPGAVISASHNPYEDNGIKIFAPGGRKLSDTEEREIEAILSHAPPESAGVRRAGAAVGQVGQDPQGAERYAEQLVASLGGRKLGGMRVVVDCANGAATRIGPAVLEEVGLDVVAIHASPDGRNINDRSGSTDPDDLRRAVVDRHAHAGLALDGDADRVVAVDNEGNLVDGDRIMAVCALDLRARGKLARDTVVVTVMSNLGLRRAMEAHGVSVVETQVGDRHVLAAMEEGGFSLGGEQSGHIIFRDLATTGDGILTGLQLLDAVQRDGRPLADLAREAMTSYPQVLRSVRVGDRDGLATAGAVWDEVAAVEAELGDSGRVLLRPSGTEPVVRVMVEADTQDRAAAACDRLCHAVAVTLSQN